MNRITIVERLQQLTGFRRRAHLPSFLRLTPPAPHTPKQFNRKANDRQKTPFRFDPKLQIHLWGRRLLMEECADFSTELIQNHIDAGVIQAEPGIQYSGGRPQCLRCGNTDRQRFASYHCARCGKTCDYCRACLTMGVVKRCSRLLTWAGPPPYIPSNPHVKIRWNGQLSPLQQRASEQLVRAAQKGEDFIIWAVCGAGKTEVLYEAMADLLRRGKRIAVAAPRTDVVIELATRFKKVFADVDINVLYGASQEKYRDAPLILATTHQLLRFYERFDAIFIDEVDAFPFHHDLTLHRALEQSLKNGAPRFYLTATPTEEMKGRLLRGNLAGVKIPLRFHGYPLPEPRFVWIGNWEKQLHQNKLPKKVEKWILGRLKRQRPGFLFIPTIDTLDVLVPVLKRFDPRIEGVHAEDPERHEKVKAFREGGISVLATTTILERGVTIPFSDVAVFGADGHVFDERALVQIGGRVGRDPRDPTGDLIYFHYGITNEMVKAKRHICQMNKEGKRQGGKALP